MLKSSFPISLFLFLAFIGFGPFIHANHDPQHLSDLRSLLNHTSDDHTDFVSAGNQVSWSPKHICITDSSGLLNAVFAHSYHFDNFESWLGVHRPQALDYFHAIVSGNRFHQITNVTEVRPGDILVIAYPVGCPLAYGDNGHVAIVDKTPNYVSMKDPIIPDTQQWTVNVIDCAMTGHGIKDSRYLGSSKYHAGLGRGTFRLYINQQGTIVGYTWDRLEDSHYYPMEVHPLVIGRFIQ